MFKSFTQFLGRCTGRFIMISSPILIRPQNQPLRARHDIGIELGIIQCTELLTLEKKTQKTSVKLPEACGVLSLLLSSWVLNSPSLGICLNFQANLLVKLPFPSLLSAQRKLRILFCLGATVELLETLPQTRQKVEPLTQNSITDIILSQRRRCVLGGRSFSGNKYRLKF